MEEFLLAQPEGKNTKFLKSAHNLWFRFKNYDKHPASVLIESGDPCAFVFATTSQRSKYMNLYEIATVEGKEGKGYASEIWSLVMANAKDIGVERLKISCTPSSVSWHKRNGLVFWAVDPSGSLRSDQPLFGTRGEQLAFREKASADPKIAFPSDQKTIDNLIKESPEAHGFGAKKSETVSGAIKEVGVYWLRESLVQSQSRSDLGGFF